MTASGWLQLALYVLVLLLLTKPLGLYLVQVLDSKGRTRLEPVLGWFERLCYRLFGIDPHKEQTWRQYGVAMLVFTLVTVLATYGILRLQNHLWMNPQNFAAWTPDL